MFKEFSSTKDPDSLSIHLSSIPQLLFFNITSHDIYLRLMSKNTTGVDEVTFGLSIISGVVGVIGTVFGAIGLILSVVTFVLSEIRKRKEDKENEERMRVENKRKKKLKELEKKSVDLQEKIGAMEFVKDVILEFEKKKNILKFPSIANWEHKLSCGEIIRIKNFKDVYLTTKDCKEEVFDFTEIVTERVYGNFQNISKFAMIQNDLKELIKDIARFYSKISSFIGHKDLINNQDSQSAKNMKNHLNHQIHYPFQMFLKNGNKIYLNYLRKFEKRAIPKYMQLIQNLEKFFEIEDINQCNGTLNFKEEKSIKKIVETCFHEIFILRGYKILWIKCMLKALEDTTKELNKNSNIKPKAKDLNKYLKTEDIENATTFYGSMEALLVQIEIIIKTLETEEKKEDSKDAEYEISNSKWIEVFYITRGVLKTKMKKEKTTKNHHNEKEKKKENQQEQMFNVGANLALERIEKFTDKKQVFTNENSLFGILKSNFGNFDSFVDPEIKKVIQKYVNVNQIKNFLNEHTKKERTQNQQQQILIEPTITNEYPKEVVKGFHQVVSNKPTK